MKIKNLLFNPVHPVKKLAATLLLSAGLGLSLSGAAQAGITTTGSGIAATDNDTYATRVVNTRFEYRQINDGKVLTVSAPRINFWAANGGGNGGAFSNTTASASLIATVGNVTFANNSAGDQSGGAIYSQNSATLTHTGGTLAFVSNTSYSGGMYYGGDFVMTGNSDAVTIASNIASGFYGGAINTNNMTWSGNVSGTLSISGNFIAGGYGGCGGGALAATGNVTLGGSHGAILIASNTAGMDAVGGAFYATKGFTLSATVARNFDLTGNSAASGGVLSTDNGTLNLFNNVGGTLNISRNTARNSGGAFDSIGTLTIGGSHGAMLIASNTSGYDGGAFRVGSVLYPSDIILSATVAGNLSISGNSAAYNGGAFNASDKIELSPSVGGTLTVSGNQTGSYGGAFYAGKIILGGSYGAVMIVDNSSYGAGAFDASTITLSATIAGNLSISDNHASAFRASNIEFYNRVTGTLNISGNYTSTQTNFSGGALYASSDIILGGSYGDILITSNTTGYGGGALCAGFNNLFLTTTVAGNLTVSGNSAGGSGGAFNAAASLTLNNRVSGTLTVSDNRADSNGGAFNAGDNLSLNGSYGTILITSNTSVRDGGALYSLYGMQLSATAASLNILNNRAGGDGGAAFTINQPLTVSGSYGFILVANNISGANGGAFYTHSSFNLNLAANSTLFATGNKANTYGGFLYTNSGSMLFNLGAGALAQIGNANSIANRADGIAAGFNVDLYKSGAGVLQLWGDNTYSGYTYVNGGRFDLRGLLASTRVEVSNGATLHGSGTVTNSVAIFSGGTIATGDSLNGGVLTTGPLTLSDGAVLSFSLAAATGSGHTRPADNSLLVVNGNLTSVATAQIDLILTTGPVNGAVYDLIKYTGVGSGNVNLRKLSGSGATGVKISDFKFVNTETGWLKLSYSGTTITTGTGNGGGGNGGGTEETWDLAGLTSKGLKLSAAKTLVVPKGVKLLKGTKAIYTWKRDGATVLSGSGKNFTAKDSGTYTLTLSYTTADGQQHSQTQNFGKVKLFAQPKTATLSMAQTTDTITNSALRATSVVSGESLKLTVSVGTVGGGAVGPFRYVWYCGSAVVRTQQSSATSDTFTTPAYGDKAVGYKCVVELVAKDAKNKPLGTTKSKDLKAKIILPPSAVTLSASATTVKENGTLTLSASAKGTATLLFTWYKNGAQIATGSAKKFAKKPVSTSDAGTYYVVVSQSQTTRRAQSASVVVNIQRADGSTVSGAQSQSMSASPTEAMSTTATASSGEPRRQDAAGTLPGNSAGASVLNLAPLSLSAGDVLTVSGSATREYIIVNETQHTTGAYHYEWRDNVTAEFQDADDEAHLTLRFITIDGGVYELSISGSVGETGVFELRKK